MKTIMKLKLAALALLLSTINSPLSTTHAASTVDAANRYAYAANLGWVDWRGDTSNGAVIGEYVCSGYIYSANVGWINIGGGSPTNGIRYLNLSSGDFGLNHDGLGNLRGYAWGANIGWINFEDTGAPTVDLLTGNLSGYAWSANCDWISLSNATARVRTASIAAGTDSDGDGLADAWELTHWTSLSAAPGVDSDGDGLSNLEEYLAGTDPTDANDCLRITSFQRGLAGDPNRLDMSWTSVPSRQYAIQQRGDLATGAWADYVVFQWLGVNNAAWNDATTNHFYRIRAFRPLMP